MAAAERSLPAIPVFDLSTRPTDDAWVGEALAQHGLLSVVGHDVDLDCQRRACAAGARAFALPDEIKARYQGPIDGSQRGFAALRTQLPSGRDALDRKEAWHARAVGHQAENIFPDEVPEFGPCVLMLIDGLEAVSQRVLAATARFLGSSPDYFETRTRGGESLLRLNHYPRAIDGAERDRFREHQDYDLITLILAISAPGLETQTRDGVWRSVVQPPGAIAVMVGELLEIESGGRVRATPHRVVPSEARDGGRSSIAYFVSPRNEVILANGASAGSVVARRLRAAGYS